jgi:hypothetical protein
MAASEVRLEAGEAAELAELLSFPGDWLVSGGKALAASLGRFVDDHGNGMAALRPDLARFAFLLTGEDGQQLFGGEPGGEP